MKMLLTLDDHMYKNNTRKTLLRLTSLRAYRSKLMMKFSKKVAGGFYDYFCIVTIEKK